MRLFIFSRYLVYSLKSNTNSEVQKFKFFRAHQSWRHEICQIHRKGEVNDFPLFILYFKVGDNAPFERHVLLSSICIYYNNYLCSNFCDKQRKKNIIKSDFNSFEL